MAMTGVMRPGHLQLRVLDLQESVKFYTDVLGLVETARDAQGRVYFKAWDERDHNSLIIRQADKAGMDFMAFKVDSEASLEKFDADLRAYGVKTERIPAGELLETGERVRFELPTGHLIELYVAKSDVGNGQSYVNPDAWTPLAEHGIAPTRMDHALLYGPNIEEAQKILVDILGFFLVEHVEIEENNDLAIWLSCSTKAHDIAFVRHAEPGKLHHVAFMLESWEKVLRAADIMSMNKVQIDIGPTRPRASRAVRPSMLSTRPATVLRPSAAAIPPIRIGNRSSGPSMKSGAASSITTVN